MVCIRLVLDHAPNVFVIIVRLIRVIECKLPSIAGLSQGVVAMRDLSASLAANVASPPIHPIAGRTSRRSILKARSRMFRPSFISSEKARL